MKRWNRGLLLLCSFISFPLQGLADAEIRGGKNVSAGVWYGFLGGIGMPGIYGAWHQSSNLQLGLAYSQGSANLAGSVPSDDTVKIEKLTASAKLADVQARYFFGNSFSVTAGLFYRNIKTAMRLSDPFAITVDGSTTSTSYGSIFSIGNQWQLENGVHFGCDWLGITIPLQGTSSSDVSASGFSETGKKDQQDIQDKLAKNFQSASLFTYLTLRVGYSF